MPTTTRPRRSSRPTRGLTHPPAADVAPTVNRPYLADYLELTKPRIAVMALITVAVGYLMGAAPSFDPWLLINVLIGAGLVAAGGSALNHVIERRADARMDRTANRPVPAGRLSAPEAATYGVSLAFVGVGYLLIAIPTPAAAIAAFATFALYVFVYTPLKRVTAWNTVVGAIPGALPPVIGWCAARGSLRVEGLALFAILFVWQLPHFFSIAWMHRADYARGGMRMLPIVDRADGLWTGRATVATCLLLIAAGTVPTLVGAAGWWFFGGALLLGFWFLGRCLQFARHRDHATARRVLRGSLVYLMGVMALLIADGVVPLYRT